MGKKKKDVKVETFVQMSAGRMYKQGTLPGLQLYADSACFIAHKTRYDLISFNTGTKQSPEVPRGTSSGGRRSWRVFF